MKENLARRAITGAAVATLAVTSLITPGSAAASEVSMPTMVAEATVART